MSLNTPALNLAIRAAFSRQAAKPGPNKSMSDAQLGTDLATAISQYILSGRVNVNWKGVGGGIAVAPWPGLVVVFSVTAGVGLGYVS